MLELLKFLESPLGRLALAIGGAAFAALVAFGEGYQLRGKLDGTAAAEARAAFAEKQLAAARAARAADQAQAQIDNAALAKRTQDNDNAVAKISSGVCLDGHDADGLRDLWSAARKR